MKTIVGGTEQADQNLLKSQAKLKFTKIKANNHQPWSVSLQLFSIFFVTYLSFQFSMFFQLTMIVLTFVFIYYHKYLFKTTKIEYQFHQININFSEIISTLPIFKLFRRKYGVTKQKVVTKFSKVYFVYKFASHLFFQNRFHSMMTFPGHKKQ